MIVKYNNNELMNRVVPGINNVKNKIPTNDIYTIKNKCPDDFNCRNLLNQVLNELQGDSTRLKTLSNNINTKNTRIMTIDRNIKSKLYSDKIETMRIQKPKI